MPSLAKKNLKHIALTHIADYVATKNILGPMERDPEYPFDHSTLDILGISESYLKDMEAEIVGSAFSDEYLM